MKKLAVLLIALLSLLSGCVVYDGHYRDGGYYHYHDGSRNYDRDRDGVPDRQDRRPYDPYRY